MPPDLWVFENKAKAEGFQSIAGIDEAGRGPLAGPVVSAAVILPDGFAVSGVNDSKKLTLKNRQRLYGEIYRDAVAIGIGIVDPLQIDRINILQAALQSMLLSLESLSPQPDFLLIDGVFRIASALPQHPIIHGDSLSISIAAASIVAKVTRDKLMDIYHQEYPQFGFDKHKGYPTCDHRAAIRKFGCCPIHRKSFRGVKEHLL
jgi:ribonuclease HII